MVSRKDDLVDNKGRGKDAATTTVVGPRTIGSLHRLVRHTSQIRASKLTIALGDTLMVALAATLALWFKLRYTTLDPTPLHNYLIMMGLVPAIWPAALSSRHLYQARFVGRRAEEIRRIIDACVIAAVAVVVLDFMLKMEIARTWALQAAMLSAIFLIAYREVVRGVYRTRRRRGVGLRRVVIVGDNAEALDIEHMFRSDPGIGYQVVGRVVQRSTGDHARVCEMLIDDTFRALTEGRAHGVVIAVTAIDPRVSNYLVRTLAFSGIHLELSSALSDISADRLSMHPMGRIPVLYVEPVRRMGWRPAAKRLFDIMGATLVLLVLAPLLAGVAIAVKVTSPGPVFFRQERLGRGGTPFRIVKFRTMAIDAEARLLELLERNEADGPLFKLKDDPRVTHLGKFLRRSSIDELPQLWNVLRGEMSLVGPRPALAEETQGWTAELFDRLRVRPGMTGMWQVSGRSDASFDEYIRLDLYYVDNWSLLMDMMTIAKTIPAVLSRRGAS